MLELYGEGVKHCSVRNVFVTNGIKLFSKTGTTVDFRKHLLPEPQIMNVPISYGNNLHLARIGGVLSFFAVKASSSQVFPAIPA